MQTWEDTLSLKKIVSYFPFINIEQLSLLGDIVDNLFKEMDCQKFYCTILEI